MCSSDLPPRRLDVIAPAAVSFDRETGIFTPGSTRTLAITVTAERATVSGTLRPTVPDQWRLAPASQAFSLAKLHDSARLSFTVTAPSTAGSVPLTATTTIGSATYGNKRIEINYPHIPLELLQPAARLKLTAFPLVTKGRRIGYIAGAGDAVADAISQMGYAVVQLTGADCTPQRLDSLDAVVIGIRASNVRTDLTAAMP